MGIRENTESVSGELIKHFEIVPVGDDSMNTMVSSVQYEACAYAVILSVQLKVKGGRSWFIHLSNPGTTTKSATVRLVMMPSCNQTIFPHLPPGLLQIRFTVLTPELVRRDRIS